MQKTSYEKGLLFEEYITTLFNSKYFERLEWYQSKELPRDQYHKKMSNPDLTYELHLKGSYNFAVECKWRENFSGGKLRWDNKDEQVSKYLNFQYDSETKVFLAIGIGGKPDAPQKLFLTSLNNIIAIKELSESNLFPHMRNPGRRFFFDTTHYKLV